MASALSLKNTHRLSKSTPPDELLDAANWKNLSSEIIEALEDGISGLLLLTGPKGCGKSSYQASLCRKLEHNDRFHVIRGVVAQPIEQRNWLFNFLQEVVCGEKGPKVSLKQLIQRITDLTQTHQTVVIAIEGIDLISPIAIQQDLCAFNNLINSTQSNILIIANLDFSNTSQVVSGLIEGGCNVLVREIPTFTNSEISLILRSRLKAAGIDEKEISTVLAHAAIKNQINLGQAIGLLVELLGSNPPTERQKDAAKAIKRPAKEKPDMAEEISFDDFLARVDKN
jgi:hypothetical protein